MHASGGASAQRLSSPRLFYASRAPFTVFRSKRKVRKPNPKSNKQLPLPVDCIAIKGGRSKAGSSNAESKLAMKKTTKKGTKAAKDPNKPKRPPSAFFVFMEDFRKQYKEKHPNNKSAVVVGKAGGEKWKSLNAEEKAPYVAKAVKRKEEYEIKMEAYNRTLAGGDDAESDKSRSEVNSHIIFFWTWARRQGNALQVLIFPTVTNIYLH